MAPEYLPEQGRRGLTILPPLNNDHLARDIEVDQEVVLFVSLGGTYTGALKPKTAGVATYQARKTSLGVMDSATRRRIEAIAWEVGVAKPDGQWNCQHWILALLGKLYENRVINQAQWSKAVADASHLWDDWFARRACAGRA
ncbi:hypothetical protein K466DRAFT_604732 [Polyporus arcularius HHB13444]|uniref:Uncharacterized protein n=1 Tax=Polyporus arcularius HHB13444 TaxID=1314778 RepID=A0A5C3NUX5_9APHY|nr:hypothetical protein K466DRAFT_604732 [Polyporus arcularius HHB13444]